MCWSLRWPAQTDARCRRVSWPWEVLQQKHRTVLWIPSVVRQTHHSRIEVKSTELENLTPTSTLKLECPYPIRAYIITGLHPDKAQMYMRIHLSIAYIPTSAYMVDGINDISQNAGNFKWARIAICHDIGARIIAI